MCALSRLPLADVWSNDTALRRATDLAQVDDAHPPRRHAACLAPCRASVRRRQRENALLVVLALTAGGAGLPDDSDESSANDATPGFKYGWTGRTSSHLWHHVATVHSSAKPTDAARKDAAARSLMLTASATGGFDETENVVLRRVASVYPRRRRKNARLDLDGFQCARLGTEHLGR